MRLGILIFVWILAGCYGTTEPEPPVPTSIVLSASDVTLTSLGATAQLDATVRDQHGEAMPDATVTWSSSNDAVVTVSGSGLVTALASGSAAIEASSGSAKASASVVVQLPSVLMSVLTADSTSLPADGRTTTTLHVQLRDSAGDELRASGGAISFDAPSAGSIGPTTDHGDGTYSAQFLAGTDGGTVTIVARLDGEALASTVDIVLRPLFYLAGNGVTVLCPEASLGDSRAVDGIEYTKRSRADLDALVAAGDFAALVTACTTGITDMRALFESVTTFNEAIGSWDTSAVTDMTAMFFDAWTFDQPVGFWDVGNVREMSSMFAGATDFDQPIGAWDMSAVTDISYMFAGARSFDQPIDSWDVSRVIDMSGVFGGASSFDQPIGAWDVSSVVDMRGMFSLAVSFGQPIGSWDVSGVTSMRSMFNGASSFDQPIGSWDVGRVRDMFGMFADATIFNQPIASWDVSNVTNMTAMFAQASSFDQPIGAWDVSRVTNMDQMFYLAASFNRDLSGWCVVQIPSEPTRFDDGATAWVLPDSRPVWGTCPIP